MTTLNSSQYKNLFFTYVLSNGTSSKGTIILLDGLPSNPLTKNHLMQKLAEHNYDVFFPRYEGTWESKGEFLKRAPSDTIIEFIKILRKGRNIGNKKHKSKKVFLLGSSFGGGIALDIATKYLSDKICVISPVISFKRIRGIEALENYLKTTHVKDYRFSSKNWQKLMDDEIWSLKNINKIINPSNILIITGKNDDQIKENDVIEFGEKNLIKVRSYDFGHITLSKIPESILTEILSFFSE